MFELNPVAAGASRVPLLSIAALCSWSVIAALFVTLSHSALFGGPYPTAVNSSALRANTATFLACPLCQSWGAGWLL